MPATENLTVSTFAADLERDLANLRQPVTAPNPKDLRSYTRRPALGNVVHNAPGGSQVVVVKTSADGQHLLVSDATGALDAISRPADGWWHVTR